METNIREYGEHEKVKIITEEKTKRLVIQASNEGGFNCTEVDLIDQMRYIHKEPWRYGFDSHQAS